MNITYPEKINKPIFICFVIWLIALGGALKDFNSHSFNFSNLSQCVVPLTFIFYIIYARLKLINFKPLWLVLAVLLVWQFLLFLKYNNYVFLWGRMYDVLFAFVVIRTMGLKRFLFYFETAVSKLCIISVLLWTILILFPSIKNMLVPLSFPFNHNGTLIAHWGIVGISNSENFGLIRNLGFAWEPGRFASVTVMALLMHLFRTRFILFQKNFWPLLLGVLTSLSTTGYMTLCVCVIGYFFNASKSVSSQVLKIILPLSFIILIFCSPFLLDKIVQVSDANSFLSDGDIQYYINEDVAFVPQRTEALYWEFLNIKDSPLLGYGGDIQFSYIKKLFPQLNIFLSEGILQIVAVMGIPLSFLVYLILYKSSNIFAKYYNIKGSYLFFLAFFAVNVSYNFFYEPLFICIVVYCLFMPASDKKDIELQKCKRVQPELTLSKK